MRKKLRSTNHQVLTKELSLLMTIMMMMAVIITTAIIIIHSRNHRVFLEYISEIWKSQNFVSRNIEFVTECTGRSCPHSSKIVVLFYVLFVCTCVLYFCHRVITQLQLTNISYHVLMQSPLLSEMKFSDYCLVYSV